MEKSLLATLVSTLLLTTNAYAAESQSNTDIEVISIKGSRLDKAATATGLPLTLRETPQSVTIIDQEFIQSFSLNSVADLMFLTPGIYAQKAETNRYFFSSRGNPITNFQFDGVPINYSSFFNDASTDTILFDRVEVVRGATGLLTGAGEPSAAINLIRKRPKATPGGYLSTKVGSWDSYRVEGDASLDVTQSGDVQARFAAAYEKSDSYIELSEEENLQVYGVVTARLTDNTLFTLGADYSDRDPKGSTWGGLPLFYADGTFANDLPTSTTTAASWSTWKRNGANVFATLEHGFENSWDLKFDVEHRKDEMDGHLLYLYGAPDKTTGLGMDALSMIYQATREQDAARLFASGPFELFGKEHKLTAGLLYSKQNTASDSYWPLDSMAVGNFFEWDGSIAKPDYQATPDYQESEETQNGAYLATQFNLHTQWMLLLGGRISQYKFESNEDDDYNNSDVFTPYAGLIYNLSESISVYTSYTEIFQPQDAKDANNKRLDPMTGNNIELGAKGDFFDEKLTASIAVFKVQKENVAERDPNYPKPLPDGSYPMRGVDGTSNQGYEVELNGKPTENWDLFFSYTHSKSEDNKGNAFRTHLPTDLVHLSSLYHFNGALEDLAVGGNLSWQSEVYKDNAGPNGERSKQNSYYLMNLMASYQLTDDAKVQLNINNLFDEKYYSSIDFYDQGFFGDPRNIELSLNYNF
ncbi:TonB-dependent siderophore receptor [Shewanella sp. JM162201]|uniref:TonB-dependent siderophore receptor n=1 Tax=Shewanella jiangmenensis TaxID=2837387 RepID=A0ABS5V0W7_9GAMM|nr:TonB-dependent siderophore receptor [Shewanella jiangmenensis]MBT1444123.1 TonB-dependent siderophore receptor [Shewanella jiangmenensis]